MLRIAVLLSALAGCGGYRPGALIHGGGSEAELADQRVTVDCLDVAVARRPDYDGSVVLQYRFGNRCNQPVQVDLQRVAVAARLDDGREVELSPHDPQLELQPVQLAGRHTGGEAIAYPTQRPTTQVCVDAASIVHAQPARWLCFATGAAVDENLARDLEETP